MLTDKAIRAAKAETKPYKMSDGGGLYLFVKPNGSRLWRMKYRVDGIEKTLSFGAYPQVSLSLARERRDESKRHTQLTDDARLDKVRYDARTSLEKATRQVPVVQVDLQRHLSAHGIELLEEHREWHDAQDWITGEIQRLKETDLVRYKEEAEQARHAAEVAFRKDIAVRLREQIQRMRTNLRLLDGILRVCPPFSNGERYRFEAKPAPAHRRGF